MATKIYIDQGHNPINPNAGAEGSGYREQDLVFRIGLILSEILQRRGFETRLSRPNSETILGTSTLTSLSARVNDANSWGADLFVSLHTNASAIQSARGSEVYVYSLDSPAAELASDILFQLNVATGLPTRGVFARPGLYVLRRTQMPAVLVELGFITNFADANLMANSPELFAVGVADGISVYLDTRTSETVLSERVEDSSPNRLSYSDFLTENNTSGTLQIRAYKAREAFPVPGVRVVIFRNFSDGEKVFFSGITDENGIIDNIELPAPPRANSLNFSTPDKVALYELKAILSNYESIEKEIEIFDSIETIQPLIMRPVFGGDR